MLCYLRLNRGVLLCFQKYDGLLAINDEICGCLHVLCCNKNVTISANAIFCGNCKIQQRIIKICEKYFI